MILLADASYIVYQFKPVSLRRFTASKPKQANYVTKLYIYEKCGPLTSLIPHPGLALPLSSGQAMRTPTPNMTISATPIYNITMLQPRIIPNVVFTIASLTRDPVVLTMIIQVASLGVKSALVNTNQYICQPRRTTTADAANGCKSS